MSTIPSVNTKKLLDAGVHFGHKTSRWNPKMASYIYGKRDDVHIIDLRQCCFNELLSKLLSKQYMKL